MLAVRSATTTAAARPVPDPLPVVRRAVRDILTACPAYAELPPERQLALAQAMVRVSNAAASLIREEIESQPPQPPATRPGTQFRGRTMVARAQAADGVGATAANVADTTRAILNAVSFPRFVEDLINGVFRAMLSSSTQQMQSYVELLNGVAASTDGFGDSQMGPARARQWLVEHYPDAFEIDAGTDDEDGESLTPEERRDLAEEKRDATVRARPGGTMPTAEGLRADLGLPAGASIPLAGDPERTLVPFIRTRLAKMRQEMLATMVSMGMQRIVVESGRITASMRFHIDTRDAVAHDEGSRFGLENEIKAAGSFGYGPWGVSASVRNNISYVSTQKTQSTQEMNTDLELNSGVEINFKSDYVPLNQLATRSQADAIRSNSRNPDAAADAVRAEEARRTAQRADEAKRRENLDTSLKPNATPPPTREGEAGTVGGARRAQDDAEAHREQRPIGDEAQRPDYERRQAAGGGGGTKADKDNKTDKDKKAPPPKGG